MNYSIGRAKRLLFLLPKVLGALIAILLVAGLPSAIHFYSLGINTVSSDNNELDIWWPADGVNLSGTQPFKAMLKNNDINNYDMFWSVDNGNPVSMYTNDTDYPHKEATVDLSGWNWHGKGPYVVTFTAKDHSGNTITARSVTIQRPDAIVVENSQTTVAAEQLATTSAPAVIEIATVATTTPVITTAVQAPLISTPIVLAASETVAPSSNVDIWWPTNGSVIVGPQPFKALLQNRSVKDYNMYWQVDNGQLNQMVDSFTDYPHKEISVDATNWNWHGGGPYIINFVAQDLNGNKIAEKSITIYNSQAAKDTNQIVPTSNTTTTTNTTSQTTTSLPVIQLSLKSTSNTTQAQTNTTTQTPTQPTTQVQTQTVQQQTTTVGNGSNPIAGAKFFIDPNSDAMNQIKAWASSRPADADLLKKIAYTGTAQWLGDWNRDIAGDVRNMISANKAQGSLPVFVVYNIPGRDCGNYSAGGAGNFNNYRTWINTIAQTIGSEKAAILLEPDALTLMDCLSSNDKALRLSALSDAVSTFKSQPNIAVYLDAGHPGWVSADDIAVRLRSAGISKADGFALNISNFTTTADNISYGTQVSQKVGNKHFVIDTGRNGNGPTSDYQWCNPWGRALGDKPTTNTGNALVDALLWVKGPGGSDGNCNGGPNAGVWFPDIALDMAKNTKW